MGIPDEKPVLGLVPTGSWDGAPRSACLCSDCSDAHVEPVGPGTRLLLEVQSPLVGVMLPSRESLLLRFKKHPTTGSTCFKPCRRSSLVSLREAVSPPLPSVVAGSSDVNAR